jgi:pimeloyl-ACP methyl ester carboxylesterase
MTKLKITATIFIGMFFLNLCSCATSVKERDALNMPAKKYDLVLVHGLSNIHCWGEDFLLQSINLWGPKHVFAVYTTESGSVWERDLQGKPLICCGEDTYSAGDDDIATQSKYLNDAVLKLQESCGLGQKFCIVAHSMGGLVARHYIAQHPGNVAGLVTLGTPHHGDQLADSFGWIGFFIGAGDAVDNLSPDYTAEFNRQFPIPDARVPDNCKIYTIRGDSDGYDSFGWGGELFFGWPVMRLFYWTDSDGIVSEESSIIDGAMHIGDFSGDDHYDLVRDPAVVIKAAEYLP